MRLGPDESAGGRGFADPDRTETDVVVLELMRVGLRKRIEQGEGGGTWRDAEGDDHLLAIPDVVSLRETTPALAIGFFGDARADVDPRPIIELELALLDRGAEFRGFLAYYDLFFAARRQWGNLVLFASEDDASSLASDAQHRHSIGLAPEHYHSVRLHRFALSNGALGEAPLRWLRTAYFDFDSTPHWRAMRESDAAWL